MKRQVNDAVDSSPASGHCEAEDTICPVCQVLAVPPVTVTPCGHTLCGECFTTLRTRGASIGDTHNTLNFRCPRCRRAVTAFAVSDSLRRIVLAKAPETLDKGDGVALVVRELDERFMATLHHDMPGEAPPMLREIYDAHMDDEERDGAVLHSNLHTPHILSAILDPYYMGTLRLMLDNSSMTIRRLNNVPPTSILRYDIRLHDGELSGSDDEERSIARTLDLVNCRIPRDLRMWTRRDDVFTYHYWRAHLSPDIEEAFIADMSNRGVRCESVPRGYLLTLPDAEKQRFLAE